MDSQFGFGGYDKRVVKKTENGQLLIYKNLNILPKTFRSHDLHQLYDKFTDETISMGLEQQLNTKLLMN